MKIKFIFFLLFVFFYHILLSQEEVFNIKNFGAIGDGRNDDYKSIQSCFKEAVKYPNSKVIIPFGNYKITKQIIVSCLHGNIEIEGEVNEKGDLPTIFNTTNSSVLWVKGYLFDEAKGVVRVNNIKLKSSNIVFSEHHPMINKKQWNSGLSITDKKEAYIYNVIIENIYGQGIHISDSQQTNIPLSARFKYVEIKNCQILNVWGYNPMFDDYGDGIYLSNVASALVKNNTIKNDFNKTKQLGRVGIVIEFMSQKCNINNNYIFGYDRGMHLEADYGNHNISYNQIEGTDLGIVVYNPNIPNHNNPIEISNNTISNQYLHKKNQLKRVRGITGISDRALLDFTALNNSRKGSVVKNNLFIIDGNYDYFSNSIINIRAEGISLLNNTYTIRNKQKLANPINYFIFSQKTVIKGESLNGINGVVLKNAQKQELQEFKRNNKIDDKVAFIR